jgi:peptidoglycan/xylan/chitin deacetylase (PgdA/CDA1 family)
MNCIPRSAEMSSKKAFISGILSIAVMLNICCTLPVFSTSDRLDENVDIYRRNENEYMKIALTFDDGPHPRYTPQILEILDEFGIKATFFVIGVNAKYYPDTMEDIIRSGHEIGNHTYSHPHVSGLNSITLTDEVEKCESTIYGLTDYKTKLFRPPEGLIDADIRSVLRELDYKVILWDIDTKDWANTPAEEIADNVIEHIESGDIILMHDYIAHNSPTPEALKIFIPKLISMGYKFVVVSELIGLE